MWNYIKSFFQRSEVVMKTQRMTFTVVADVTFNDPGDWKRKVRGIRKALKTVMATDENIKILKIENKQD